MQYYKIKNSQRQGGEPNSQNPIYKNHTPTGTKLKPSNRKSSSPNQRRTHTNSQQTTTQPDHTHGTNQHHSRTQHSNTYHSHKTHTQYSHTHAHQQQHRLNSQPRHCQAHRNPPVANPYLVQTGSRAYTTAPLSTGNKVSFFVFLCVLFCRSRVVGLRLENFKVRIRQRRRSRRESEK